MKQRYFQDLRRRVALLERQYIEPCLPTIIWGYLDSNDEPYALSGPDFEWDREQGEPMPDLDEIPGPIKIVWVTVRD